MSEFDSRAGANTFGSDHADVQSIALKLAELTGLVEKMVKLPAHQLPREVAEGQRLEKSSEELEDPDNRFKDLVLGLYKARRQRDKHINADLFGEPAWDMLLDIYYHQIIGKAVSVTDACLGSCVPNTTALRWITVLLEEGLIVRLDDPTDRRRGYLSLSKSGIASMNKTLLATEGFLTAVKSAPKIWKI